MIGGNLALSESKYGLQLIAGFMTRPTPRSVLYEKESNVYYQFWENRSVWNLGIQKSIILKQTSIGNYGGFLAGLSGAYTYGNFRGSDKKPDDKFLINPNAGFFWFSKPGFISITYEYLKLTDLKVSPHRINLTIGIAINTTKEKIRLKEEPDL